MDVIILSERQARPPHNGAREERRDTFQMNFLSLLRYVALSREENKRRVKESFCVESPLTSYK
jgi:hypothetical protein